MHVLIIAASLAFFIVTIGAPATGTLVTDGLMMLAMYAALPGSLSSVDGALQRSTIKYWWRVAVLIWITVILTLMLPNAHHIVGNLDYAAHALEFAVLFPVDWLYTYGVLYARPLVFAEYGPSGAAPNWWTTVILLVEAFRPGTLSWPLIKLRETRTRMQSTRKPANRMSPVHIAILVGLATALVAIVSLRLSQGFLTQESLGAAARFMLRYGLLPILLFAVLLKLSRPNTKHGGGSG